MAAKIAPIKFSQKDISKARAKSASRSFFEKKPTLRSLVSQVQADKRRKPARHKPDLLDEMDKQN